MPNYYQPQQYYQPQYYQPMQQMQQPIQQTQTSGIVWVDSDADAMNHIVMPNSCVTMRSTDGKTVYFKSADASGKPTIEVYSLQPRQTAQETKPNYVTRDEVIELIGQLKDTKKGGNKE